MFLHCLIPILEVQKEYQSAPDSQTVSNLLMDSALTGPKQYVKLVFGDFG